MAPRKSNRKSAPGKEKADTARRQLWAIALFACAVFLLFVVLRDGPNVWGWMHGFFLGLFGVCAYVLPVLLGGVAILYALDKPLGKVWYKIVESGVLVMLIGAAIDIFTDRTYESFSQHLKAAYELGGKRQGGGFFGALIGHPLTRGLGDFGAGVLIIILIVVFLMLITGTTLIALFQTISKPAKTTVTAAQELMERRAREQEERRQKRKFEIDVPIEGDVLLPGEEKDDLSEKKERLLRSYHGQSVPPEQSEQAGDAEPPAPREPQEESAKAAEGGAKKPSRKGSSPGIAMRVEPGEEGGYRYPPLNLLDAPKIDLSAAAGSDLQQNAAKLVDTLRSFGVETRVINICRGPAVTRYELQPSAGVKISKITNLADDITLNLATAGVRIEAPIPNKAAVGIEVPNKTTSVVYIRELLEGEAFTSSKSRLTMALGKDITGNHVMADIGKMPHMLIAGATGSGKSVCINSIIISLLYKSKPEEVKLLMVDPKVVELGVYNGIPHLITPVVTDPRKAAGALGWAVTEMLRRYKLFADNGVRDIHTYNAQISNMEGGEPLPQIVIIIDELADLMMVAPNEVEDSICRLAQMARAAGMHLVIATQRPSVDVITGIIKANIPSRVAFMVSSQVDSRTILDMGGAEKLMGKGDMLFYPVGAIKPSRIQGCWVSEREVEAVVSYIKESQQQEHEYDEHVREEIERLTVQEKGSKGDSGDSEDLDEMLPQAVEVVLEAGMASTSLLQRRLKLGYARAARIVDQMEQEGIVGPFEGSKPRQVLISRQQWLERQNQQ